MPTFTIKYMETQQREWMIEVEAKDQEAAEQLFGENNEDPWLLVGEEKAAWSLGCDEEGEATYTLETDWEIEENLT